MTRRKRKNKSKEFKWGGTHPFFLHPFISFFTPDVKGKVVADLGCGKGLNAYLIRTTRDTTGTTLIGLDANISYLDFCRKHRVYDKLIKGRLPRLPLKDKSVDFIICTEVIEHLTKKEGFGLLREVDRVCRARALFTTPNVYFDTVPNKKEDAHHSVWKSRDFSDVGYKVHGLGLRTPIVSADPLLRIKQALYYVFTPFSYFIPGISGILICAKDY